MVLFCFFLQDLFGVSMLMPLVPRHARDLGASPVWIGTLGTVYGVLQLISGPYAGRLGDVMGRRKTLLICLFVSAISYSMNIMATSFAFLLMSRVPLGIFKHGVFTVRAYLAEITPSKERPHVFGRFNAFSSLGFIVGPLFGGYLSEYEGGFYRVAACTASIFFLNLVFVYLVVHPADRLTMERTQSVAAFTQDDYSLAEEGKTTQSFKTIVKSSIDLLLLRFLIGISVMLFRDNITLILESKYGTTASTLGWLISYGSFITAISNTFVGRAVALYDNIPKLLLHAICLIALSLLGLTVAPNVSVIMVFLTTLSLANPVTRICVTDLNVERSKGQDTGAFLGISQSVSSVSRSISPFLSGLMLQVGTDAPGLTGVSFALAAIVLMLLIFREKIREKSKVEDEKFKHI